MNALILAAGFGTRLKPWTNHHPKALVPVEGTPMLERVINKLSEAGFDRIYINIHHFGDQIIDFVSNKSFPGEIIISDERDEILDTGGALVKVFSSADSPDDLLVHNVDILSNAACKDLVNTHKESKNDVTLLVSDRKTNRKLLFDEEMRLSGWLDSSKDLYRGEIKRDTDGIKEFAFSGIYVVGREAAEDMERIFGKTKFPLMDYLLHPQRKCNVKGYYQENLTILDIGKPDALAQASEILDEIMHCPDDSSLLKRK